MKIKELLGLSFIFVVVNLLGFLYSIHNTDPHHWGFITGTALDFIKGKDFFNEIYIQYGVGQPIFFSFINHFVKVNYTVIGMITSLIYSLNLIVIYLSAKKLSNATTAGIIVTLAFLLHSFSIYPWPDYYAGFCVSLAGYFLIGSNETTDKRKGLYSGLLLFIAFLFRNTYLISIGASALVYLILMLFFRNLRNRKILTVFYSFFALTLSYLLFISFQGKLALWFQETMGSSSNEYGAGVRTILALLEHTFLLTSLVMSVITVLLYVSIGVFFTRVHNKSETGVLILFTLLGVSGIIQAVMGYELFRIQNACSLLYFVAAFKLEETSISRLHLKSLYFKSATAVFFISLAMKFPHASTIFPIFSGKYDSYVESTIPYYKGHRFQKIESDYYDGLVKILCGKNQRIVNLTMDSSIGYLCEGQNSALMLPFYNTSLLTKVNHSVVEKMSKGDFTSGDLIVSYSAVPQNDRVKLIQLGQVIKPESIRFLGAQSIVTVYLAESNIEKNN